jgi:hypothetical protein
VAHAGTQGRSDSGIEPETWTDLANR